MNLKQARYVSVLLRNELENMVHKTGYDVNLDTAVDVIINMIDATMVQDAVTRMERDEVELAELRSFIRHSSE
jgi:hypothetical protein